jgi:hypothetical protein
MDEPRRDVVKFLEKEIKTYAALSLFLTKNDIRKHAHAGKKKAFLSPSFYTERLKEAERLVYELRKPN